MNNEDEAILNLLLAAGVKVELSSTLGGIGNVYYYEYVIRVEKIQEHLCGCPIDEYDGIDWLDYSQYAGWGFTLKDAYDAFVSCNEDLVDEIGWRWQHEPEEGLRRYTEKITAKKLPKRKREIRL